VTDLQHDPRPEVRAVKVSQILARRIVSEIAEQGLQPGARLPSETEMLSRYGVGRASLREALRILEDQGLIVIRPGPGGGPVVANLRSEEFANMATLYFRVHGTSYLEVAEALMAIEPLMARLAADRINKRGAKELRACLERARRAMTEEDDAGSVEAANAFHETIASLSKNSAIQLFGGALQSLCRRRLEQGSRETFGHAFPDSTATGQSIDRHVEIADAIIAGDADRAEELMRAHMDIYSITTALATRVIEWE
jgi:GntR family transcriptional regulator, transcriptional repressor for pyruvate dehydrogenase complex